ncbi:MAG: NADH-quinone oxidoreductase subunit NuoH [Acidimicrobiia bacterium]|nr:NADH-quinone oxidoreductase subunit NuoH [Acidimicrobiia bacterium]
MSDFLYDLFAGNLWGGSLWPALVKVVAAFALLLLNTLLLIWFERKIVAWMQNRLGPRRAGPYGVLQTLADGLKLFFKEQVTPRKVEFGVYIMAPLLALVPALLIFTVIPIGAPFTVTGDGPPVTVQLAAADLNVALLFVLAMSAMAVYAIVLAGWSSGSKYPLLGGVRATAQAISYEAAMGLAIVPVVLFASTRIGDGADIGVGTMSFSTIVELQAGAFRGFIPGWFVFWLLPSFIIFWIAAVAETNRAPFDLVEAEQEIVGGFHTEYSGIRFALFFLAEYINMFNMSAIAVTLFFGGWLGPDFGLPAGIAWVMPIFWFLLKTYALLFVYVWLRATLPRMRYDLLMQFGWKRLIPVSLAWLVLFTLVTAWRSFGAPWG